MTRFPLFRPTGRPALGRLVFSRLIVVWLMLAVSLQPCVAYAQNALPSMGDGSEMSLGTERKLGDRIGREIYRDPEYVDDAVLGDYVEDIWQRLQQAAILRGELTPEMQERYAWRLVLIRDKSVNAFALPGGYMGVNLGMIATVTSADELASVLGHETTHITQRHIARSIARQTAQTPLLLASLILGVLAASSNPGAASALMVGGQAAAVQGQLNFSRDMEREADRIGFGVMTQAGYDGRGFASMFEKLSNANRFNDTSSFPYLRSHPLTTERIADMQARQQFLPTQNQSALPLVTAMMSARARVLADTRADAQRIFLNQAAARSGAPLSPQAQCGVLYGAVLAAGRLRDFDTARRWLTQLQSLTANDALASYQTRLLRAELDLSADQLDDAAQALMDPPTAGVATPRAQMLLRASLWLRQGRTQEATQQLQLWVSNRPGDALAWQLLSSAYTAQKNTLRAIRADAEAKVAQLDYPAARDRLRAAQDVVRQGHSEDHIEASIIDARARELDAMTREQSLER